MKYLTAVVLGLLVGAFGLSIHPVFAGLAWYFAIMHSPWYAMGVAPFAIGFIACLLTEWGEVDENGYLRGKLPGWAYAWSTPDEAAPGDVRGEPWLKNVYRLFGPTAACMYWHLERNRGMGLSYMASRKTSDQRYLDGNAWGYQEIPSGAWRHVWRIGSIASFGIGNQTTMVQGQMWIRPWVSIKFQHNGNP